MKNSDRKENKTKSEQGETLLGGGGDLCSKQLFQSERFTSPNYWVVFCVCFKGEP